MKRIKKVVSFLLVMAILVAFIFTDQVSAAKTISLNKTSGTISVGDTLKLKLKNAKGKISWSSSNKKVASVTSKGKVTALKAGKTTIVAKNEGKKYKCVLKVKSKKENKDQTAKVTVTLSQTAAILEMGGQIALSISVNPTSLTDQVVWKSSDESVATVQNGIVTGVNAGTCNITATVKGVSASCAVQVNQAYGTITGTVTYYYNYKIGSLPDTGSMVSLLGNGEYKTAIVDGNGNYTISNVPVGSYKITIYSSNSTVFSYSENITISANQTVNVSHEFY